MINGLHHVAINTPDIERLSDFYVKVLGFEVVAQTEWREAAQLDRLVGLDRSAAKVQMLKGGNLYIELFEYTEPGCRDGRDMRRANDRGLVHICLDVTDLPKEYERVKAAGMTFHCEPQSFFDGKILTTYGRDPDGNIIELQEVRSEEIPFTLNQLASASA
jgi:catechol 2,3-dioxygenase-like lactoylglutathione lyase family enzyme